MIPADTNSGTTALTLSLSLCGGSFARIPAVDLQVLDDHAAAQQVNADAPDVNRTFDVARPLELRPRPHRRSQINGQRAHNGGGQDREHELHAPPHVPEGLTNGRKEQSHRPSLR